MAFSPLLGAQRIQKQYKRYLSTMFSLDDRDYQRQFEEQLAQETAFAAGPYLDAHDNFATGRSIRQLVEQNVLPEYFLRFGFHRDRPLYVHQERALIRALSGHNIVVSTGTGSGKTESFLMPILAFLAREKENGTLGPGVRALLIYPMNALANDQVERLRELLRDTPEITFGCYTGQTSELEARALADYRKLNGTEPQPNELISRSRMKETPPNILITNYAMLEYLMVRPGDNVFFSDDTWRFVVLDEAHIYRGSTGIEVSMLIRRLQATLEHCDMTYFLTSATLGDEGENAAVAEFARTLTNASFREEDVIRAVRVPVPRPDTSFTVPEALYEQIAGRIAQGDTEEEIGRWLLGCCPDYGLDPAHPLYDLVRRDERYWTLRQALSQPRPVGSLCDLLGLGGEALERLVTVASFCEAEGVRLLDARYHMFLRATESVFVTLPPSKRLFLTRAREYQDPQCGERFRVFEACTCSVCHAMYLTGKLNRETGCLDQSSNFEGKDILWLGEEASVTDEDGAEDESENRPGKLCAACGHFRVLNRRGESLCAHGTRYEVSAVQIRIKGDDQRLKKCVRCEAVNSYGILRYFFTGQEAVTSVIATSLFNALPDRTAVRAPVTQAEDEFGFDSEDAAETSVQTVSQARQFLCFSDSRQASAYFATYLDTTYRKLLYRRVMVEQLSHMAAPMRMQDFCEDLSVLLSECDALSGTSYRPDKESWKALLLEAGEMTQDASLMGMGQLALALPENAFGPNAKLNLSGEELTSLMNVLVRSLMGDLAIRVPVKMTEEDREFYGYGAVGAKYVNIKADAQSRLKSFTPRSESRSNKRLDYLTRVLAKKAPGAFDLQSLRRLLGVLWDLLVKKGFVTPVEDGYQLDSEKLCVTRPRRWYRCDRCRKLVPYSVAGVCPTYRCAGTLREANPDEDLKDNHYYRLCHDMDMRPLRVREHTAQLDREKAYEYQQAFKDRKIDVLSCSTTFEMGVDVGSLETVFMRNMPPMPSNYAQRAGRAGRSRHSAAFALTFCNRSNHDFAFFNRPEDMIRGKIHAPHFVTGNEKIAVRHLYASALAFFWRRYPELFSTVGRMESAEDSERDGFVRLKAYLESKPEDLREFARRFLPGELYEAFGCDDFAWLDLLLNPKEGVLTRAVSEYTYEVTQLEDALNRAMEARQYTDYLRRRLNNYRRENILSFFSRKNVIPQYGFPVDTVDLRIGTSEEGQQFGVQLSRDLAMAISEYAPGSQVVANGELFTSRYVRRVPTIQWKTYDYAYCGGCGTLNIEINLGSKEERQLCQCRVCGEQFDRDAIRTFIIPSFGFEIDPDDVKKPGLIRPERTYRTDVSYVGYRSDAQLCPVNIAGAQAMVLLSEKDEMAVLNRSEFYICDACGYGEMAETFMRTLRKEHKRPSGHVCTNKLLRRYSLGYRFETDVFQIHFPSHPLQVQDEAKAYSVLYAFLRGVVDVLDLESGDVNGCLQHMSTQAGSVCSLILYDTTPGGAGHMRRLQDPRMLTRAVERARALMAGCTCGGTEGHASCYGCLRSYANQRLHDQLDRSLALDYLTQLLEAD